MHSLSLMMMRNIENLPTLISRFTCPTTVSTLDIITNVVIFLLQQRNLFVLCNSCGREHCHFFSGEDLSAPERKKLQQEQMREWIKQQLQEKERESEASKHAEK